MLKRPDLKKQLMKPRLILSIIYFFCSIGFVFAQESQDYLKARARIIKVLKSRYISEEYTRLIDRFYLVSCDSLVRNKVTVDNRPVRDVLLKLFRSTEEKLQAKSMTTLRVPALNNYFLATLQRYHHEPLRTLYREVSSTQSAVLMSAFDGLPLGDSIRTFIGIKEMLNNPLYILTRLKQPLYARQRDTLLYFLANQAPQELSRKLSEGDTFFISRVGQSRNMTVQAVAGIGGDINYDKIIPFSLAIRQNRISLEKVHALILSPSDYYRAFVEEAIYLNNQPEPEVRAFLKRPISDLNKSLANLFYISEINMLHESPDDIRFRVLNDMSAKELYFLMIGGSGQLYTSSFLYVYHRFLKETEKEGLDVFLEETGYYRFDEFVSVIAGYGLVNDFIGRLHDDRFALILGNYLALLNSARLGEQEVILNAMTMSEILYEIRGHEEVKKILTVRIDSLQLVKGRHDIMLNRMYDGLREILQGRNTFSTDQAYDKLPVSRFGSQRPIVQVCLFYDDEDAASSFNNSLASYDKKMWAMKDMGNYVVLTSQLGNSMQVYMNKPNTAIGYDSSQNEMLGVIAGAGLEVTSFIHRGHSYYLFQSLQKLASSCQFVFLGSCGGYIEVLTVFQRNPDVNIIATRNIGSMLINDPMLSYINNQIVLNRDINWDDAWRVLGRMFRSKLTSDLFSSYVAPNRYIGVKFIRQVFNL